MVNKICSVDQAVALIKSHDTVNLVASGGGFQDADLADRKLLARLRIDDPQRNASQRSADAAELSITECALVR